MVENSLERELLKTEEGLGSRLVTGARNFRDGVLTGYVVGMDSVGSAIDLLYNSQGVKDKHPVVYSLGNIAGNTFLDSWKDVNKASISGIALGASSAGATLLMLGPVIAPVVLASTLAYDSFISFMNTIVD